jgi:hypothetical protein
VYICKKIKLCPLKLIIKEMGETKDAVLQGKFTLRLGNLVPFGCGERTRFAF